MTEQLRVLPNPFAFLDHEGQPAGTFPFDPAHARGARRWVGARIDLSPASDGKPKTRPLDRASHGDWSMRAKVDGQIRTVRIAAASGQRTIFAFEIKEPQPLPMSEHFVRGVKEGSLIAADVDTAKRCRVPFVDPVKALCAAAKKAIVDWTNTYGEPPNVDAWPEHLRAAAGLSDEEPVAVATPAPKAISALVAPATTGGVA